MNQADRRTLDELLVRYDLEPQLHDVYVEGVFDKEIFSHCFQNSGDSERIVYEIDTVDIPLSTLLHEGLTDGNKQRLIALARALMTLSKDLACRCLVDKDLDHWFGPLEANPVLIWTKYASIELYFFTDELLRELLLIGAKVRISDWQSFVSSMIDTLLDLYAIRLADRDLNWSMKWIPTQKHLKTDGAKVLFDSEEYIDRLLLKNGRSKSKAGFSALFVKRRSALTGDPRDAIRGHDFIEMLSWSIREFKGVKDIASVVAIERIFLLAAPRAPGLLELFPPLN
jgi:hypothetical protein